MKIRKVTLTGADESTSLEGLRQLSIRFPFVEWGILFSSSRAGTDRYPRIKFVENILTCSTRQCAFAAHLCGSWAKDVILKNKLMLNDYPFLKNLFHRMQLNLDWRTRLNLSFENLYRLNEQKIEIILQHASGQLKDLDQLIKYQEAGLNVSVVFDKSGGKGLSPKSWPTPIPGVRCGYAGGLGPENITAELDRISAVAGESEIWIDMEGNLRTEDKFDLGKCRQVLESTKRWMEEHAVPVGSVSQ